MKTTTEEWANAEICVICKQPFNPQRNVNRHHWFLFVIFVVGFVVPLLVGSAQGKESMGKEYAIFASSNNILKSKSMREKNSFDLDSKTSKKWLNKPKISKQR